MTRFLFIALLFCTGLNAQNHPLGIKLGLTSSTLSGDGTEGISSLLNFQAGFFTEVEVSQKFTIQPELLFSVYGFKSDSEDFENTNFRLNYVILPIIARLYLSEDFSVDFGPQGGLLITAKNAKGSEGDVIAAFNNQDFGINFGLGYKIGDVMGVSLRYYLGLSDVSEDEFFDIKNRSLQITLQFKLN